MEIGWGLAEAASAAVPSSCVHGFARLGHGSIYNLVAKSEKHNAVIAT